jgi:hypothetical protein
VDALKLAIYAVYATYAHFFILNAMVSSGKFQGLIHGITGKARHYFAINIGGCSALLRCASTMS